VFLIHALAALEPQAMKTWFITGASTGFGRSLATLALNRGDRVLATARQPESVADLVASAPDRCRSARLDVTDASQIAAAVAAAKAFGGIDILVNNAGFGLLGALEELTDEQISRNLGTNLLGPVHLLRAALPMLREQAHQGRRARLVFMSAAAAISNYAGFSIYGGAKAALEAVAESLALELAPLGITCTIVQPGPFRTDFIARNLDKAPAAIADYAATSGKFAALLSTMSGKQPGDPDKAAAAIAEAVDADTPPLRLVLGKYAINKARKKLAASGAELDVWSQRLAATEFAPGS
jgi:NAD(P)-dependent dehydrogenase (short-subunit alcohol dehydrogenase family)